MVDYPEAEFHREFGTIKATHYYKAQEAIRKGEDVLLVSERRASEHNTVRGSEIKEWGLDLDTLLVDSEVNQYAREIL